MTGSDGHLARRIARGDQEAFAFWLARAEEPVRISLRSFRRDVDTEAVLQEALLRVWQVADRFVDDGRPDGLLRLATRIARNLAIDEVRRRRPGRLPAEALDEAPDASRAASGRTAELDAAIAECRDQLPRRPRQAIDARIASPGENDRGLAARLGMKPNTFFQNVARARRALAECLARKGFSSVIRTEATT